MQSSEKSSSNSYILLIYFNIFIPIPKNNVKYSQQNLCISFKIFWNSLTWFPCSCPWWRGRQCWQKCSRCRSVLRAFLQLRANNICHFVCLFVCMFLFLFCFLSGCFCVWCVPLFIKMDIFTVMHAWTHALDSSLLILFVCLFVC